jgi:hypothetical protein
MKTRKEVKEYRQTQGGERFYAPPAVLVCYFQGAISGRRGDGEQGWCKVFGVLRLTIEMLSEARGHVMTPGVGAFFRPQPLASLPNPRV